MTCLVHDKKGQVRVIEAFFAAVLMLSSLSMVPTVQKITSNSNNGFSCQAFSTLANLDADGHLAELVDQRNWTALKDCLQIAIPSALWFNLTVFDENMNPLNTVLISNGGVTSNHIEAADYLAASSNGTYAIYTLRLQLAGLN